MKCLGFAVVLVAIFCSPYFLPAQEYPEDILELPDILQNWHKRGKFIEVNGNQVFYIKQRCKNQAVNSPPTFALIHGFPASSFDYNKVVEDLLQYGNVTMHDHVGFGFSSKPQTGFTYSMVEAADNTLAVWRLLGIKEAHVVAHDLGDTVLTEILARRHRDLLPGYFKNFFKSVTFTNGGMKYSLIDFRIGQTLLSNVYLGPYFARLADVLRINEVFSKQQLKTLWPPNFQDSEARDRDIQLLIELNKFRRGTLIMDKLIYYLWDRAHFEFRWFAALKELDIPARFVWSDSDAVSPTTIPKFFQNLVPNMKPVFVEGAGHFFMLERPKDWISAVIKPLTRL